MCSGESRNLRRYDAEPESHLESSGFSHRKKRRSDQSADISIGSEGRPGPRRLSGSLEPAQAARVQPNKETGAAKVPKVWKSHSNNLQRRGRVPNEPSDMSHKKTSRHSESNKLQLVLDLDSKPFSHHGEIDLSLQMPNKPLDQPSLDPANLVPQMMAEVLEHETQELATLTTRRMDRGLTFSPEGAFVASHDLKVFEPPETLQTFEPVVDKPPVQRIAVSLAEDIETMLKDYFSMDIKGVRTLITQLSGEDNRGPSPNTLDVGPAARELMDNMQFEEHVSFGDCLGQLLREKDIKDIDLGHLLGDHQDDGQGFKSSAEHRAMTDMGYLEFSDTGSVESDTFPTVCHNDTGQAPQLSTGLYRMATNSSQLGQQAALTASFLRVVTFPNDQARAENIERKYWRMLGRVTANIGRIAGKVVSH